MFKTVPKEIREEVLAKVKEGKKVPELAKQYGLSTKTIYGWLVRSVIPEVTWVQYQHLKKENEELKRIIGMITLDLERGKKRTVSPFQHQQNSSGYSARLVS